MKIKVKVKPIKDIEINNFYNNIYDTLKRKGYNLKVEKPTFISFSKIISATWSSFGWDYYVKKFSFLNNGVINLRKKGEHIEMYAHLNPTKSIVFYYGLLIVTTLFAYQWLNLDFFHVLIFLLLMLVIFLVVYYLKAKLFVNELIRGFKS
ncbi:MAG: hypothetical protein R6W78_10105 [Bacteroidales bacterium]